MLYNEKGVTTLLFSVYVIGDKNVRVLFNHMRLTAVYSRAGGITGTVHGKQDV